MQPSFVSIDILVVKMFLVCHLISQDQVIKVSCDFIVGSLVAIDNMVNAFSGWRVGLNMFLLKSTVTAYLHLNHLLWKHTTYNVMMIVQTGHTHTSPPIVQSIVLSIVLHPVDWSVLGNAHFSRNNDLSTPFSSHFIGPCPKRKPGRFENYNVTISD